ncbi:hypothetical protein COB55_03985 [Candidatus Wolfebacteria bacterium]|nr:MAG: hypothetical protein COB55_03985 [Candidatus Wolfebacteria bacterium]
MKKLLLLPIIFILTCCEIKVQESNAGNNNSYVNVFGNYVSNVSYVLDGIEYEVFFTGSNRGGIHVVNHTKELLEVELLKLQINKLKTKKL